MQENSETIIAFLKGLRRESGAYADFNEGEGGLRSLLSVLKAFIELGVMQPGVSNSDQKAVEFIRACHHENGGFSIKVGAEPSPYDTAVGLVCLRNLGDSPSNPQAWLAEVLPAALAFMNEKAVTQFDHFMLVAAYEECWVTEPVPSATLEFFRQQLKTSLDSKKVVDAAIAAASLIRAGQTLPDSDAVAALLLSGQNTAEGGFGEGGLSSLFVTYCAMRTLVLLNHLPDMRRLAGYLNSLKTDFGYSDTLAGKTSAGATYMNLSMQTWMRQLQALMVRAAMAGEVETLRDWLENGGDPNFYDQNGWTVLLGAAARGQAEVVDLLLNHSLPNALHADPGLRYQAADALPVYMAGQAGDLETVRLLLNADPSHLHAFSSVNGHTVLLQAAFYGKQKHLELAAYLLEQAAANPDELLRLLSATNVRGYNALSMQDLWHNQKMKNLLLRFYPIDMQSERGRFLEQKRLEYYQQLLLTLASPAALTEKLMAAIVEYLDSEKPDQLDARIDLLLAQPGLEINRLGGDLQMPALVFAITGVDVGNPARAERRHALARKLLEAGADPAVCEKHPMAVGAVIRASVLNNFGLLQLIADYMTPAAFAHELNVSPAVNGLTAMHDAIHRALTSPPAELQGHLAQIRWMIGRGARLDIPDNVGQTQSQLALAARTDAAFPPENSRAVSLAVLSISS